MEESRLTKAKYGYMGKMLFVDLSSRNIHEEEISEAEIKDARHIE